MLEIHNHWYGVGGKKKTQTNNKPTKQTNTLNHVINLIPSLKHTHRYESHFASSPVQLRSNSSACPGTARYKGSQQTHIKS